MPQISNLRFLFSSTNHYSSPFFSPFKPKTPLNKSLSLLTVFSSSSSSSPRRERQHTPHKRHNPLKLTRRNNSSFLINEKKTKMPEPETERVVFNKRRAEGSDNNKPKTLQLKVRKLNPINTICYVQILGTGMDTQDTSPSVLLFFDKQRFIFNAGEGLQRFCTEHKIKLSKIDHIFLSRVCSETAGGLPGLLLTLAGMGDEGMSVNIWGPSDLKYLVEAMRSFIPNAAMVHTRSFGPATGSDAVAFPPVVLIDDEVVKLSAILLQPYGKNIAGPRVQPGDISVVYVCELPEIKGKFDPAKAAALGLKPGPKYRELQLGNSVMSDQKNIMVHPSDVLGPSVPGPIVLLVDCPTIAHFEDLLSKQSLLSYYADVSDELIKNTKAVNCVIHLSPASVTSSPEYQSWMKRFGGAQHIMAGHETKNIEIPILKSSSRIAARLNYVCPQLFPATGFWAQKHLSKLFLDSIASSEDSPKHSDCISAENLLKFQLRPLAQLGLDRTGIPSLTSHSEIIDELRSEIPEIEEAVQEVQKFWHSAGQTNGISPLQSKIEEPWLSGDACPSCLENISREDMEIVLLGTGSSQPSKYRNVSSIYINLFAKGSVLLDCGEGTLGQLKRRFGVKGADDAVRSLMCVWISHIHADHHTGLARILALRHDLLKDVPHEPLLVVGPWQLKRFLDAYQRLEDLDMQFLDCRHTTETSLAALESNLKSITGSSPPGSPSSSEQKNRGSNLFAKGASMQSFWKRSGSPVDNGAAVPILKNLKKVLNEAGLEALISFPVVHCPHAFGVVLQAAERLNGKGKAIPGWKIVYSGDTRPCPELIEASRGATVLIHEATLEVATFEDGMVDEAIARNHSTTKEAIEVGDSAGAYRIILTHFSQRYPKIPVFDETHMHNTCIAFDMMSVNIADLPVLPKVLPYLKLLFRNEMIVDESDDVVNDATAAI
ncbi:tRNase Z endonuclease [Dillenia turbinata]|uniref:ribonuclease Z n=1 Tax=Dillenia turbinata TaxID=194707 RepID=A0AAN8UDK5_9MAGN